MVKIQNLTVGDQVKIVDEWVPGCRENNAGYMDRYLGTTMTIRSISLSRDYVRMEEDRNDPKRSGGWQWFPAAFEYIVEEQDDEVCSESDISKLLNL